MLELANSFNEYVEESEIVDFSNTHIKSLSEKMQLDSSDSIDIIRRTFEYVRDRISHSADINSLVVTSKASEVLQEREGTCYAKSHLMAALLRANNIPCGFCYQRVINHDQKAPQLILHGLNAVYVDAVEKWIRIDASGLKSAMYSEFTLDREKLSFNVREKLGEEDIFIVFSKPDSNVIEKLTQHNLVSELFSDLPKVLAKM
ncbi:MAG: transglutaminase-like domain-containing protein [Spirochaetaceae bacterium]|jgi:transglutaminase-like putative cysteine protease|nr:transglutaminase-like domain-containing protein [Spirochaetaceae bacterium]